MNDYARIAAVIRLLDERQSEQPDLAALAKAAGLSPAHFHRLFSRWAGVTPKDFLQALTFARVKQALRRGESALATALDAGLSGPGRLHDLCVTLEGASPGEIKSGGAGLEITAGFADTPFGLSLIAETARGVCHLSFLESGGENAAWKILRGDWPGARIERDDRAARALAERIFSQESRNNNCERPPLRVFVRGSAFRMRVWRALLAVPPGTLVTYGDLAKAADNPRASRAAGTAVADNPVAYLIPCHRVIRATGVLGNYRWDPARKIALVGWEGAQAS